MNNSKETNSAADAALPERPAANENLPIMHSLGRTLGSLKLLSEKALGINGASVMIMLELARKDGITQNYLSVCTKVDPSMITRVVKELEQERGWIRRERDPEDNRLMRVYLTEAGQEQARILPTKTLAIEQRLTKNLTEHEIQELRRVLAHLEEAAHREASSLKDEANIN